MRAMHSSWLVYGCLLVQMVALSVVVYRENFGAYESRLTGPQLTRLKRTMYALCLVTWLLIGVAEYLRP